MDVSGSRSISCQNLRVSQWVPLFHYMNFLLEEPTWTKKTVQSIWYCSQNILKTTYILGVATHSNSDHQGYHVFSRGSVYICINLHLPLLLGYWEGGHPQNIFTKTHFHHDLNNPVEEDSVKSAEILHNFQSSEFLLQKRPKKATELTFPGWRASMWLYSCDSCAQHIQSIFQEEGHLRIFSDFFSTWKNEADNAKNYRINSEFQRHQEKSPKTYKETDLLLYKLHQTTISHSFAAYHMIRGLP